MTIRTRILLAYGYLVTTLVASAAGSALAFHHLGRSIATVFSENVASLRVATGLLDQLERQDSATLEALLGRDASDPRLEAGDKAFRLLLGQARANVTAPGEAAVVARIETSFEAYITARSSILTTSHPDPLAAYEARALPAFATCKGAVVELLELNTVAIRQADQRSVRLAARASGALALLVAATLLSVGLLSRSLQEGVLERLGRMGADARAIASGDLARRLRVGPQDELGVLAHQLNSALAARDEVEDRMRGVLAQQRQVLLGMLGGLPRPAALLGLDGSLVASTMRPEIETSLMQHRVEIAARGGHAAVPVQSDQELLELDTGTRVSLTPLVAPPGRPVGWLVQEPHG